MSARGLEGEHVVAQTGAVELVEDELLHRSRSQAWQ
jgi:hypothetical protein